MSEVAKMNENDIIIYEETSVVEQTGTLLTSIPKKFHERVGVEKGSRLQWKLKEGDYGLYLVMWVKKDAAKTTQ
jgi:hypothetical protein